ncbi:MAG: Co2+/Mg2+ efflux protein ApaG [Leptospiraceae bacterium]|nr:Co2+/Mg2+ efflux protein ApaG [Leptospiraceae bacterium]MDW8307629.1 Co2+/Mg2+ efflux protein ApaG [Leptospiraceae bacterium]
MKKTKISECITDDIRVRAVAAYLPEESHPEKNQYMYGYRIQITNLGSLSVQLRFRHWIIINSDGKKSEVRGPGVVGEFPFLRPGDSFEYASFCPLDTDFGTMEGSYTLYREDGKIVEAKIPRFYLATNAGVDLENISWEEKGLTTQEKV